MVEKGAWEVAALNALDRATVGKQGKHKPHVNNVNKSKRESSVGNANTYALRKLRPGRGRPGGVGCSAGRYIKERNGALKELGLRAHDRMGRPRGATVAPLKTNEDLAEEMGVRSPHSPAPERGYRGYHVREDRYIGRSSMGAYKKIPGEAREMVGAFSVECPECGAPPGFACRKPGGKSQYDSHKARRERAYAQALALAYATTRRPEHPGPRT